MAEMFHEALMEAKDMEEDVVITLPRLSVRVDKRGRLTKLDIKAIDVWFYVRCKRALKFKDIIERKFIDSLISGDEDDYSPRRCLPCDIVKKLIMPFVTDLQTCDIEIRKTIIARDSLLDELNYAFFELGFTYMVYNYATRITTYHTIKDVNIALFFFYYYDLDFGFLHDPYDDSDSDYQISN